MGTWLSLAVPTPVVGQTTVDLEPWLGALRSVPVEVGGDTVSFLLDTGEGTELNVFVPAATPGGRLWLKLDSGNVDRTLLDLHAAPLLGLEDVHATVPPTGETEIRETQLVRLDQGRPGAPFSKSFKQLLDRRPTVK